MIGKTLAHYEIVEKIGAGGMGEVYRASDSKLGRDVALKVLPTDVARDDERMARFQREAQLLASLNHPHIGAIYGIESSGDTTALVLELIEGPTLEERIRAAPLPLDDALDIARQIADAVEAAHDSGIVHRDLKPMNVKITPEGRVKVLDFGLAKALDSAPASGIGLVDSPTISPALTSPVITGALTGANVILGTAAYMSPEQARGHAVDRRADVWAFGVIVYEMLTGLRLFQGETVSDTLAEVLKTEPDWDRLPAQTPRSVRRMLRRCLVKDPAARLRSVADAVLELDELVPSEGAPGGAPAEPTGPTRRLLGFLPWGIAAALAGVLLFRIVGDDPAGTFSEGPLHYDIRIPEGQWLSPAHPPAPSPDGKYLAIGTASSDGARLWLRPTDGFEFTLIVEGGGQFPFWSPDSRELAYFADGELRAHDISTGNSRKICDAAGSRGGSWGTDGRILLVPTNNSPIHEVDARGGTSVAVTALDSTLADASHRYPHHLPGGRHFLFTFWSNNVKVLEEHGGIYIASRDGKETRRILRDASPALYADPGHLLIHREGKLLALPFDPGSRQVGAPAHVVAQKVMYWANAGMLAAGVSMRGGLVFGQGSGDPTSDVVWLGPAGEIQETIYTEYEAGELRLSPSGRRFAGILHPPGTTAHVDLWVADLERSTLTRLTRQLNDSFGPVWSPDEQRIVFSNMDTGRDDLLIRNLDQAGAGAPLFHSDSLNAYPTDWSPDGRTVLFDLHAEGPQSEIWSIDVESRDVRSVRSAEFAQSGARFSPDAGWIVYDSAESGENEVCVSPYPDADRRWQISSGGGRVLSWSRDGREILYRGSGAVWAVRVDLTAPDLAPSVPEKVLDLPAGVGSLDATSDHQRFLAAISKDEGARTLRVVRNWNPEGSP